MATWNELFEKDEFIATLPQPEVYKFVRMLEKRFSERPLKIWDVCCGAGRHTALIAELGHDIYASDNAPNALTLTQNLLKKKGLTTIMKLSDMTVCPWDDNLKFHGVLSWDAIHHNTIANIQKAVDIIYDKLIPEGLFMGCIKAFSALNLPNGGKIPGVEIEPNTIVFTSGPEASVPHHFFDEANIRNLFKKWKIELLVEQQYTYVETTDKYWENNPFHYSTWGVVAKKT